MVAEVTCYIPSNNTLSINTVAACLHSIWHSVCTLKIQMQSVTKMIEMQPLLVAHFLKNAWIQFNFNPVDCVFNFQLHDWVAWRASYTPYVKIFSWLLLLTNCLKQSKKCCCIGTKWEVGDVFWKSHLVNSHFVNIDQVGNGKVRIDKVEDLPFNILNTWLDSEQLYPAMRNLFEHMETELYGAGCDETASICLHQSSLYCRLQRFPILPQIWEDII